MTVSIILASSSRYRAALLSKILLPSEQLKEDAFIQIAPNIDERTQAGETPQSLVMRLSVEKAKTVQKNNHKAIVIASDQVACSPSGEIIGKPLTVKNAISQLRSFSGKKVSFYTGLSVVYADSVNVSTRIQTHLAVTHVYFRTLQSKQIEYYVRQENPLDCAGGFKSEGLGISLFERIESEDPNSLVGLPLIQLCGMLSNIGFDVLSPSS
ncbi:Maf family protein [Glaciecola petra]|uniref:7-methyl-GTP pyrophosphatase n=1 Tax=Glaciecola petra TaxID=3075602 RepID=A0ABU2ZQM6_9ALTE|nr:nucleoside triphosphate pyrophosphatase [Aestuariibacter sp. P117]MDT0594338.1 nucleoside triphosphate pyrophosphatase [Aestuariibacter sp. P117]